MPTVELPVVDSAYHQFWRTPLWRWWRPVVALVVGLLLALLVSTVVGGAGFGIDIATGRTKVDDLAGASTSEVVVTPAIFLANNLALALLIPLSMLVSWWFFRQGKGWLASVTGHFRWGWLGRCLAVLTPLWLVYIGIETALMAQSDEGLGLHVNGDTWVLLVGILLTTPFQAAGEEYAFRGVVTRSMASFFRNRWAGFALGALVSSVGFMLVHGAGDVWLNIFYFSFGLIACGMTLRTGGIEAAIAMHVVNNLMSEWSMPFTDISGIFNREAGTAGPEVMIGVVVPLIGWALVEWQARRAGIVRTATPGQARQRELEQQLATWQQQVLAWEAQQRALGWQGQQRQSGW